MASIIWCDHIRHVVDESREQLMESLANVRKDGSGWLYVTPIGLENQRVLNAKFISSVEAMPGDGV